MVNNNDYNIDFTEASKILGKSMRTVSRYIKEGWLNPEKIESKRGTLEYRFSQADLSKFKKPGKTERTEQTRPENDIITFLKDQIKIKDETISQLIERSRETNILLKGLQNQLLLTEGKKEVRKDKEDKPDKTGQGLSGFFRRLFKGEL